MPWEKLSIWPIYDNPLTNGEIMRGSESVKIGVPMIRRRKLRRTPRRNAKIWFFVKHDAKIEMENIVATRRIEPMSWEINTPPGKDHRRVSVK
jgi:hypothetical protein